MMIVHQGRVYLNERISWTIPAFVMVMNHGHLMFSATTGNHWHRDPTTEEGFEVRCRRLAVFFFCSREFNHVDVCLASDSSQTLCNARSLCSESISIIISVSYRQFLNYLPPSVCSFAAVLDFFPYRILAQANRPKLSRTSGLCVMNTFASISQ